MPISGAREELMPSKEDTGGGHGIDGDHLLPNEVVSRDQNFDLRCGRNIDPCARCCPNWAYV